MRWRPWRQAWQEALYDPGTGFYRREAPLDHFRTSVDSPAFADAVRELAGRLDDALGRPDPFDVVDLGAGRGELLHALPDVPARWRLTAVELRPVAGVRRLTEVPRLTGLLLAHEWLDDVPLDVVEDGRTVLVADDGQERLGDPAAPEVAAWADRWWPGTDRVEVGRTRDRAWAGAVAQVERGLAVAVDYAHLLRPRPSTPPRRAGADARDHVRPRPGTPPRRVQPDAALVGGRRPTLTGYRAGRQVRPVPDGSCDITAHVAADAVAAATGSAVLDQRTALRRLGATADVTTAHDTASLRRTTSGARLLDPDGAGAFAWVVRAVGVEDPLAARLPR